jgi:UDP-glucose 4-epimerase
VRVLATGGAGYIGSITVRHLLDAGHEVTVLDTLERGHRVAVDSRADFVEGSVGDVAALDIALRGCDAVLHLAGYIEVAESQTDPARYFRGNVVAPLVMLDSMVRHGVSRLVFSSTAAVYGEPTVVPIAEDAVLAPVNAYGASKLMFEQCLDWYGRAYGLHSIRLRYFNVAGAWADGSLGEAHDPETHIIPRILRAIASGDRRFEVFGSDYPTPDGTCVRDYIHVCDLALAHRLALEALADAAASVLRAEAGRIGAPHTQVFNLGTGNGYSNLEVVRACVDVAGEDVEIALGPRRAGDPAVLVASADRARSVLGWSPERPELTRIVEDAWRWHSEHPDGYRDAGVTLP